MKDRLAQFLKSEGLTAVKFAEIMEVQPSSISHLLSGRNKPNFEFISRMLLRFPDLNPDWMINGKDDVYKSKANKQELQFTDVKDLSITDVNQPRSSGDSDVSLVSNTLNNTLNNDQTMESTLFEPNNRMVTNVTAPPETKPETTPDMEEVKIVNKPDKANRAISRVILFYTDGSFEEYHN